MSSHRVNPSMANADFAGLAARLDAIATTGSRRLRSWRLRLALRRAARWAPLWLAAPPLAAILARIAGVPVPDAWSLLAACLLGPLLGFILALVWAAWRFRPARAAALALYDRQLRTRDRLVTADEFIASGQITGTGPQAGFMRAAVEDAHQSAVSALETTPALPALPGWSIRAASWWGVPLAVLLVLLARGPLGLSGGSSASDIPAMPGTVAQRETKTTTPPQNPPRRPAPPPAVTPERPDAGENQAGTPPRRVPRLPQPQEAMEGQANGGSNTQSGFSAAGTRSSGQASNRRPAPREKKPETERPAEPAAQDDAAPDRKRPRQNADGNTADEADSGQGRSPASSSALNDIESPREADNAGLSKLSDVEDEGAEDEDESEKSSSASIPTTGAQQPPAPRNLATSPPGEGTGPPTGRGGPGDVKKTRGVSSMVLGIPVPDRVPGTPGPGRAKVSQEMSRPKQESHPSATALTHRERTAPIGRIEQPDLTPSRRALIQNYFLPSKEKPPPAGN